MELETLGLLCRGETQMHQKQQEMRPRMSARQDMSQQRPVSSDLLSLKPLAAG